MATSFIRKRSFVKDGKSASGGVLLGYARVSKGDEQNNVLQARALRAAGCRRLFEEAASGGRWDRPELHRMLDHLREGDTVVVWKLDRLSRSLKDVLHIMERIAQAGAGFQSITENIDTTTRGSCIILLRTSLGSGSQLIANPKHIDENFLVLVEVGILHAEFAIEFVRHQPRLCLLAGDRECAIRPVRCPHRSFGRADLDEKLAGMALAERLDNRRAIMVSGGVSGGDVRRVWPTRHPNG